MFQLIVVMSLLSLAGPVLGKSFNEIAQEKSSAPCIRSQERPWPKLTTDDQLKSIAEKHAIWLIRPNHKDRSGKAELTSHNMMEGGMTGLNLREASFGHANLRDAFLDDGIFEGADFSQACMQNAYLVRANLEHVKFFGADLRQAILSGANLVNAKFAEADLTEAILSPSEFREDSLLDSDTRMDKKKDCDLGPEVSLGGSVLDPKEHEFIQTNAQCADFTNAILRGAELGKMDLRGANLSHADLSHADLTGADLRTANLNGANLTNAELTGALVAGANLTGANLHNADMSDVNLSSLSFDLTPEGIPNVLKLRARTNDLEKSNHLENLSYTFTPLSLKELERKFDEAGMIDEEQAVITAIEHTRTKKLLKNPWTLDWVKGLLRVGFFQLTSDYGWNREKILKIMFLIWLSSSIVYALFIALNRNGRWGIRVSWAENTPPQAIPEEKNFSTTRASKKTAHASPDCFWPYFKNSFKGKENQQNPVSDLLASLVGGMYTSTLFSFNAIQIFPFGLSSLDLSEWIATTLNPRECQIHAAGWIKLIAFMQSITSLYLLGLYLWLTLGHPFG